LLLYETYEFAYTQRLCADLAMEFSVSADEAEEIKSLLGEIVNEVEIASKQTSVDNFIAEQDYIDAKNAKLEESKSQPPSKKKLNIHGVATRIVSKIIFNV
jgi:hypothetical protein